MQQQVTHHVGTRKIKKELDSSNSSSPRNLCKYSEKWVVWLYTLIDKRCKFFFFFLINVCYIFLNNNMDLKVKGNTTGVGESNQQSLPRNETNSLEEEWSGHHAAIGMCPLEQGIDVGQQGVADQKTGSARVLTSLAEHSWVLVLGHWNQEENSTFRIMQIYAKWIQYELVVDIYHKSLSLLSYHLSQIHALMTNSYLNLEQISSLQSKCTLLLKSIYNPTRNTSILQASIFL